MKIDKGIMYPFLGIVTLLLIAFTGVIIVNHFSEELEALRHDEDIEKVCDDLNIKIVYCNVAIASGNWTKLDKQTFLEVLKESQPDEVLFSPQYGYSFSTIEIHQIGGSLESFYGSLELSIDEVTYYYKKIIQILC